MGFETKLQFIKQAQREYKERFGEDLYIDFEATKKIMSPLVYEDPETIDRFLKYCIEKHGADESLIKSGRRRIFRTRNPREAMAMAEFSYHVIRQKWCIKYSAKLINRDRTLIHYFSKQFAV